MCLTVEPKQLYTLKIKRKKERGKIMAARKRMLSELKSVIFTFKKLGKHNSIKIEHLRINPKTIKSFFINEDLKKLTFEINIKGTLNDFDLFEQIRDD